MQPRLGMPDEESMTPEQKEACREAVAGKRGKIPTPMIAWLRNPELARRNQLLGELLRYQTTLEPHLTELAILVCARHWTAHLEWTAHKKFALEAGLDPQIIADIAANDEPRFTEKRAHVVYGVSMRMLKNGRLPDAVYEEAVDILGERGLVELVSLLGYYCLASFTLNTFQLGLPEGFAPELNDAHGPEPGGR